MFFPSDCQINVYHTMMIVNSFILGGRGVTYREYHIEGRTLADLYSAHGFPDRPTYYSIDPSFGFDFVGCVHWFIN